MNKEIRIETAVGKRIQLLRKSKGYTQMQLSEMIGVSPNYLSDIERGIASPKIDKYISIINALDCSADDIFSDVTKYGHKFKASHLSEKLESLPKEDQDKIFAVLDILINGI